MIGVRSNSSSRWMEERNRKIETRAMATPPEHLRASRIASCLRNVRGYLFSACSFDILENYTYSNPGSSVKKYVTDSFSSAMVFMSLLLTTQVNIILQPNAVMSSVSNSLYEEKIWSAEFWVGMILMVDMFTTLLGLLAIFSSWRLLSTISESNSRTILRSGM